MILGFKDRFVPFVLDGSKTHTIRAGDRWRVGMRADLFARPRQKDMRLLFRAAVLKVEPISINIRPWKAGELGLNVRIEGTLLDAGEAEVFFRRDGFREPQPSACLQAWNFWRGETPFAGQIIHWDYERRFQ